MPQVVGTVTSELNLDTRKALQQYNRFQRAVTQNSRKDNIFSSISADARDFDSALGKATNRVVSFGAAAAIFTTLAKATSAFAESVIEVEQSLAKININFKETSKGIQDFGSKLFNVARQTGQSFEIAAKAAEELARQGLGAEDTLERVNAALILSRRTGLDAAESVTTLTAAINSFASETLSATEIVNKLVAVDTKFAVSSKDIAQGIARAGSTAQAAGVGIDELIGLITSLQQTTALGGANIGNGIKAIFTRVQAAPETIRALNSVGVAIKDTEGNLRSATDILKDYAVARNSVGQVERAALDRQIAGTFQINKLKAALNDLSKANGVYARATQESLNATDEAIVSNQKLNETLESLINQTSVSIKQLFANLGQNSVGPLFKDLLSQFENVRKFFSGETGGELGKTLGDGIIKGLGNVISAPALTALAVVLGNAFGKVITTIGQEARSLLQINGAAEARANIQKQINYLLSQANASEQTALNNASSLLQKKEAILAIQARINQEELVGTALTRSFTVRGSYGVGVRKDPALSNKIPGFADPIGAAVSREQKASGLPASQIYVDRDSRVANFANPAGLLVANRRDEPLGGYQGVNRVISQGGNPKLGSIPGFADSGPPLSKGDKAFVSGFISSLFKELSKVKPLSAEFHAIGAQIQDTTVLLGKAKRENVLGRLAKQFNDAVVSSKIVTNQSDYSSYVPPVSGTIDTSRAVMDRNMARSRGMGIGNRSQPFGPAFPINPDLQARLSTSADARNGISAGTDYSSPIGPADRVTSARAKVLRQAEIRQRLQSLVGVKRAADAKALASAEEARLARDAAKSARIQHGALIASFALPFAAGFVPSGKGGTGKGIGLGAVSGAANGAGVGGIFGPVGLGVGAAVGALIGAFNKAGKSIEEFTAEVDEGVVAQSKLVDAAQKVFNVDDELTTLKQSGGGTTRQYARLNNQKLAALSQISDPAIRAQLAKGFGSDEERDAFRGKLYDDSAKKELSGNLTKTAFVQNDGLQSKLGNLFHLIGDYTGGGKFNLFKIAGDINAQKASRNTNLTQVERNRQEIGDILRPRLSFENVGGINTKNLISANGNDPTQANIDELTKDFADLGAQVEINAGNFGDFNSVFLKSINAVKTAKSIQDANKAGAATGLLGTSAFLNKPNGDVFGNAALTGRSPFASRGDRAQSRYDVFQELSNSKATGFDAINLEGQPGFKQARAGVQANNIGDILIRFLQGNSPGVNGPGKLRDGRGNPQFEAIQRTLDIVAKSGGANADLAKAMLTLIPQARKTLSDAGVNGLTLPSENSPNFSSGLRAGVKYETGKGRADRGASYNTRISSDRSDDNRFLTSDALNRNPYGGDKTGFDLVQQAAAATTKAAETLSKSAIQVNVNIQGALDMIAKGTDASLAVLINTAVGDAVKSYYNGLSPQLQQFNSRISTLEGKPLPPTTVNQQTGIPVGTTQ